MAQKTFRANDASLSDAIGFVEENLDLCGASLKASMQITVAVEEIFVNVAHYAYPEGEGEVTVSVCIEDENAVIVFFDEGIPFDPLAKDDPDITLSAEERNIGGLGIFMVKKSMDKVGYERKDGKNIFTMVKRVR